GGGAGADGEAELGPLEKYFESTFSAFDEEAFAEQQRRAEEDVAACMREHGFDYVPVLDSGAVTVVDADSEVEVGSREWAAQYGFGVSTTRGWSRFPCRRVRSSSTRTRPTWTRCPRLSRRRTGRPCTEPRCPRRTSTRTRRSRSRTP